jgi:16S rRNA G966 N2-methylase RsmD
MDIEHFIRENYNKSNAELSLLLSKKSELPRDYIINQINGRNKARTKFPFLLEFKNFEFPSPRAISQASSEQAAKYKSKLFSGKRLADLSGGMGLDSYFFSKQFDYISYIEPDLKLFNLFTENIKALDAKDINCHNQLAEDFIKNSLKRFNLVYIDPDRRIAKSKAFKIDECEPNLKELLPFIWEKTDHCLVKLSPMLDIKQALTELNNCRQVIVVAIKNDCKELLFHLEKDFVGETLISTVNLNLESEQKFEFTYRLEQDAIIDYSEPYKYLLDPNVAILKSGAFKSICQKYEINKIGVNTHLYTTNQVLTNFPGRQFKIIEEVKLKKGTLSDANVISKNYPLKTEQIKSKFRIKEGGDDYLIALTDCNNKKRVFKCLLVPN